MDITVKLSGTAGEGIQSIGDILTDTAALSGINVLNFRSYGAEIRASGNSDATVRLSDKPVSSFTNDIDILISTQGAASMGWVPHLKSNSIIIFDNNPKQVVDSNESFLAKLPPTVTLCGIPITDISQELTGISKGKNVAALGALLYITNIPKGKCIKAISQFWKLKGDAFINKNLAILEKGYEFATNNFKRDTAHTFNKLSGKPLRVLSGNQATASGAVNAGCGVYAGYPITPATPIFEMLARELPKTGGRVIQTEDEISAISVVLGASFTGTRAMTATSGPGISLMIEQIGLSSMAEVPCVIVCVQRGGPSTGLPTKTEQSDLNIAIYGGHGDSTRIVLAPTNVAECYSCMIKAFDCAQRYQLPVIVLSDFFLANRRESISKTFRIPRKTDTRVSPGVKDKKDYKRFKITKNGISPMSIPGMKGLYYTTTGLEHNEHGTPVYDPESHTIQTEKRFKKLQTALKEVSDVEIIGDPKAQIGIISWGSSTGAVIAAIDTAKKVGIKIKALKTTLLWPLPQKEIKAFCASAKKVIIPEMNFQGQFANQLGFVDPDKLVRANFVTGVPISTDDIMEHIVKVNDVLRKK